jgi:hypothetical protein
MMPAVISELAPITSSLHHYAHLCCREVQPLGWARQHEQTVCPPPALLDFVSTQPEIGRLPDDEKPRSTKLRMQRTLEDSLRSEYRRNLVLS